MNRRPLLAVLAVVVAMFVAGCAEVKYAMHMDPGFRQPQALRVWPEKPDKARYRYVGQLIGEDNFVAEGRDARQTGMTMLRWLVGLTGMTQQKIELQRPQTGMADGLGRVYVTDVGRHAVFVFDQIAGKLHVWEQAAPNASFITPVGIAAGPRGEILVADSDLGAVIRLDRNGAPLGFFGQDVLERPTGLARDAARGRTYVADTHSHDIKVFDDDGRLVETIGERGEEEGELNYPTHLAFAGDRLYVSDSMNARVVVFDAHGHQVASYGRRGRFVGDLTRPKGVAVDSAANIYVVESFYDNLLVFNGQGQFLMPIGGTGKDIGQFYLPSGVWTDAQDRIYVADMFNGRVVIFQFLGGD